MKRLHGSWCGTHCFQSKTSVSYYKQYLNIAACNCTTVRHRVLRYFSCLPTGAQHIGDPISMVLSRTEARSKGCRNIFFSWSTSAAVLAAPPALRLLLQPYRRDVRSCAPLYPAIYPDTALCRTVPCGKRDCNAEYCSVLPNTMPCRSVPPRIVRYCMVSCRDVSYHANLCGTEPQTYVVYLNVPRHTV